MDILEVIVFSIAIFLLVYLLIFQPHKIKGTSMEPNFPNDQYLLTDKVSYRLGEPERGDVIVFAAPETNGEEFIKRIIGLPGERISIKDGRIFINGKVLEEPYLSDSIYTQSGSFMSEGEEKQIPNDGFFVLGDNRQASSDSRAWGFIKEDDITGRAWIIYWPPPEVGLVPEASYNF